MAPVAASDEDKNGADETDVDAATEPCRRVYFAEKNLYKALMTLVVLVGFSMVLSLFMLQAYLSWKSHQVLTRVQLAKQIPQGMYNLYFDYLEWGPDVDLDKVDLRVNTTIFVH